MPQRASLPRYAQMLAALGAEPRLRILRLLLSAYPAARAASRIQARLGVPASTLSHHLEALRRQGLVTVQRQRRFRYYAVNPDALRKLLNFLCRECCCRSRAVEFEALRAASRRPLSAPQLLPGSMPHEQT